MDWFTDCVYRYITQWVFDTYNKNPDHTLWLRTEFMSADWYIRQPQRLVKHLIYCTDQATPYAQIYWWQAESLCQTAQDIDKKYPDFLGVELNIWCPSPRIMKCEAWALMMKDKQKTLDIIKRLRDISSKKFTIKTRIWLFEEDIQEQMQFIVDASEFCDIISVHGRTFKQSHSGFVRREEMYELKRTIRQECLFLWNWGLTSYEDCLDKLWNLDWVMVAQAAIWNPWIFVPHEPTPQDRYDVIKKHLEMFAWYELYVQDHVMHGADNPETYLFPMPTSHELILREKNMTDQECEELYCPVEFRKHVFSYLKTLTWSKECKIEIASITSYKKLHEVIKNYFASLGCSV